MGEQEAARHRPGGGLAWVVGAVALVLALGVSILIFVIPDLEDVLRAYPSPERHAGVSELEVPAGLVVPARETSGDFDGDGVPDRLDVEYFHMEPLHRPTTSGMVHVRCGSTGNVLLAHAVPTPFSDASWTGDVDGNGTDDVVIHERNDRVKLDNWIVLGRRAPQ